MAFNLTTLRARQSDSACGPLVNMISSWAVLTRVVLVLVVAISVLVVGRLDDHRWGEHLRTRFVAGVPWGTLLTIGFVLLVYLFVQGGFAHWRNPVSIPFRAWSYLYPLGIIVAPFAHVGPSHLTGNLLGTLVLAPLAEFAWGHYPVERNGTVSSRVLAPSSRMAALATTPIARILAVPAAAIGIGLFTGLFSIGPIIGFSGVVFAFAGFSLVRYPLATVVAYAANDVLAQIYYALRSPVVNASAGPGGFGPPWWATIAIQAHALGLLAGVVLAICVFRRRETMPSAGRLWLGTLIFAVGQSLWAVYWFRGNGQFVLFRALGIVLVFALSLLVAASITMPGRFRTTRRWVGGIERRTGATVVMVLALAVLAAPAIPANLTTTAGSEAAITPTEEASASGPEERLSIRDYTVYYAENVTNREVSVIDLSAFNQSTVVNASGVIVESTRRNLWTVPVRKSRLAFSGCATVGLGGIGWRQRVHVSRNGWNVIGGGHTYKIRLGRGSHPTRLVYRSDPATAGATIEGRNISIVARREGFGLAVSRANETLDRVKLPENGTSVRAATLTFTRNGSELFVSTDGTRVRVAKHEQYH